MKFPALFQRKSESNATLELFRQIFGWRVTSSGVAVTLELALRTTVFLACARLIGQGLGQCPLELYRESPDGRKRTKAREHPLFDILFCKPNHWQTSYEFREMLGIHCSVAGNFYAFKNKLGREIRELLPLEPNRVKPKRETDGTLLYDVQALDGTTTTFAAEHIWHVRGPSWDGWRGLEMMRLASDAIGLANAIETSQAKYQQNGMQASGIYAVEGTLDEKQYEQIAKWIAKNHFGAEKTGVPMILDRNAKWTPLSGSAVDSQMIESRKFQIEEICRAMGVMPIMVGLADKTATFAGAEQMFLAHVIHCLSPWFERTEQSIGVNLLTDEERRGGLYANFDETALLRGVLKDMADFVTKLTNAGVFTRNDGRAVFNLDAIDGHGMDIPLDPTKTPTPKTEPEKDPTGKPE